MTSFLNASVASLLHNLTNVITTSPIHNTSLLEFLGNLTGISNLSTKATSNYITEFVTNNSLLSQLSSLNDPSFKHIANDAHRSLRNLVLDISTTESVTPQLSPHSSGTVYQTLLENITNLFHERPIDLRQPSTTTALSAHDLPELRATGERMHLLDEPGTEGFQSLFNRTFQEASGNQSAIFGNLTAEFQTENVTSVTSVAPVDSVCSRPFILLRTDLRKTQVRKL